MTQDVRESRIQVAVDLDLRNIDMVAICALDQLLRSLATRLDNFLCVASQKYFSNCLLVLRGLSIWEMPWRVERFGER
jgi:hypothetical protein